MSLPPLAAIAYRVEKDLNINEVIEDTYLELGAHLDECRNEWILPDGRAIAIVVTVNIDVQANPNEVPQPRGGC